MSSGKNGSEQLHPPPKVPQMTSTNKQVQHMALGTSCTTFSTGTPWANKLALQSPTASQSFLYKPGIECQGWDGTCRFLRTAS